MDLTGLAEKRNRAGTVYYEDAAGEIVAKVCSKCSEVKELDGFYKNKNTLGGRRSECRDCTADHGRKYYEENRDHYAEYKRKYYEENRDSIVDHGRKYREENRDSIAEYKRKYYEENQEQFAIRNTRRRARKAALPDTLTDIEYAETLSYFGNACALTGETKDLHCEHAIPLAAGHGGTIRENMYPMAGRLNLSKGDRNIFEWFEANRQRFELSQERFDKLIDWLASANAMTIEEYRDYVYWCHANPREIGA